MKNFEIDIFGQGKRIENSILTYHNYLKINTKTFFQIAISNPIIQLQIKNYELQVS